jgi:thiamine-phosphate pyrophosphorylase
VDIRTDASTLLNGIYAIVNEGEPDLVALTRAVLAGGVHVVQYRAKSGIIPEHAHTIRELTRAREALFIINDEWRAVETYDADGVHLGPEDAAPGEVARIRQLLPDRVIGVSCGTEEEARVAQAARVDYIGVGSVYATSSKADAGAPIGIAGLYRVARATNVPVAAIGGITLESIPEIRATGVAMAAVISAISAARDAHAATAALVRAWNGAA